MTIRVANIPEILNVKNSALLIVDVQEKLIPKIFEKEMVIPNIIKLIKFAEIVNIPVIYTEQYKLGSTIPEIKKELSDAEPICKKEFGCFLNENFRNHINRFNIASLIITGIETHICISQTTLGALEKYNVHVVSNAVSSRTRETHKVGLDRMYQSGAVISSIEMVMFELLKKADTEEFKETLKLIK